MPGVSYVPANGRQTLLLGVIWVPSAVRVRLGFGRRNAVISCALDSSIPICPARSVGLFCSNRWRTCSQVKDVEAAAAVWATARQGSIPSTAKYFTQYFFTFPHTPT